MSTRFLRSKAGAMILKVFLKWSTRKRQIVLSAFKIQKILFCCLADIFVFVRGALRASRCIQISAPFAENRSLGISSFNLRIKLKSDYN